MSELLILGSRGVEQGELFIIIIMFLINKRLLFVCIFIPAAADPKLERSN